MWVKWRHGFENIEMLNKVNLFFHRERDRRNPKVERNGSLFLVCILNNIKNEYCKWRDELDMLHNFHNWPLCCQVWKKKAAVKNKVDRLKLVLWCLMRYWLLRNVIKCIKFYIIVEMFIGYYLFPFLMASYYKSKELLDTVLQLRWEMRAHNRIVLG